MQRYLDKDLEDTEHHALMQHVRQCPDCSELFARLIQMSTDLENLPKVTPSFSLVDAIMPRLDELDASSPVQETSVYRSGESNTHIHAAAPERRRRWMERLSFRIAGGVVAAGLLVGFVFMYQNNTSMYNADGLLMPKAQKMAESTGSGAAAGSAAQDAKAFVKEDKSAPAADNKLFDSKSNAAAQENSAQAAQPKSPPPAAVPAPSSAPAAKASEPKVLDQLGQLTQRGSTDSAADGISGSAARTATPPAAASNGGAAGGGGAGGSAAAGTGLTGGGGLPPAAGSSAASDQSVQTAPKEAAAPTAPNTVPQQPDGEASSAAQQQFTFSATGDSSGGAGKSASSSEQSTSGGAADKSAQASSNEKGLTSAETPKKTPAAAGIMGITVAEPESAPGVASKDGAYTAKFADRRVVVYGQDGTTVVFTSELQWKESDVMTWKGWTGDEIAYEVKSGADGTVKTYTINAKTKKETEKTANR